MSELKLTIPNGCGYSTPEIVTNLVSAGVDPDEISSDRSGWYLWVPDTEVARNELENMGLLNTSGEDGEYRDYLASLVRLGRKDAKRGHSPAFFPILQPNNNSQEYRAWRRGFESMERLMGRTS